MSQIGDLDQKQRAKVDSALGIMAEAVNRYDIVAVDERRCGPRGLT
jgi:hypothetical protein